MRLNYWRPEHPRRQVRTGLTPQGPAARDALHLCPSQSVSAGSSLLVRQSMKSGNVALSNDYDILASPIFNRLRQNLRVPQFDCLTVHNIFLEFFPSPFNRLMRLFQPSKVE